MQDMKKHLESLLRDAAECRLISDLATDPSKRDLFAKLAEHHRVLAEEVERAIAASHSASDGAMQSMLARHLATTERHIAESAREIAAQQADIAQLQRTGSGTAQAERILHVLNETQSAHEQNRARILAELENEGDRLNPGGLDEHDG